MRKAHGEIRRRRTPDGGAAKKSGKKLTIGYQHRHKPESTYLKQVIGRGDLGEVYYAKACHPQTRHAYLGRVPQRYEQAAAR